LIASAQFDIGAQRDAVVCLRDGIEKLVQRDRRARRKPRGKIVAIEGNRQILNEKQRIRKTLLSQQIDLLLLSTIRALRTALYPLQI
jgi:hypothetical protein